MKRPPSALAIVMLFAALFVGGCKGSPNVPDLKGIYDKGAMYHGTDRNPVIVIPGILGSRLRQAGSETLVWGAFGGDFADPETDEGARLVALPMADGVPLKGLRDEVVPDGVLDRLKVRTFGLPIELRAYLNILGTLGAGGYRDEELGASAIDYGDNHFTCFQFPYDWRRDNVENAMRLHEFMLEKRAYVAGEYKKRFNVTEPEIKFDIVAHSMGGLITRYYLRFGAQDLPDDGSVPEVTWAGAEMVERVILVGTPNAGSAKAIVQQVEGIAFGPTLPKYGAAILGTFPSIYQLFPRTRHGALVELSNPKKRVEGLLDIALWEKLGWGLTAKDIDDELAVLLPDVTDPAARRQTAREHVEKSLARAEQFHDALDQPARRPMGLELSLFAGDAVPTSSVVGVDLKTGKIKVVAQAPGDGTVARTSTVFDERVGSKWKPTVETPIDWSHVTFLFADHLELTREPTFTDNVLYTLLEQPRFRMPK